MKILMVNKFHYIKGGSETYYFALKEKLEEAGHSVIDFSMKDDKNFPSKYSKYFVENVDYSKKDGSILYKLKMAINIIYSNEAKRKFEALIKAEKPDIIHLHIFQHQISPSILDIIKKYNIPTVYTAHDLKMICLNYKMMHHNRICEECKGKHWRKCLKNKCVKDSRTKSVINVIEGYFHSIKKSYDNIDYVITPSCFYKNKFIEMGVEQDRLIHIPNFLAQIEPMVNTRTDNGDYFLYFGRLSEEKGILTLVEAMKCVDFNLYIVGTGPLIDTISEIVGNNSNIKILGFMKGQELIDIVANAKAIILPSEWYENGPYTAIEALQLGRPIIGSNIGGIPELINGNGYLFEPGNVNELIIKLKNMINCTEEEYQMMEIRSKQIFEENYIWEKHKKLLLGTYEKAIHNRR